MSKRLPTPGLESRVMKQWEAESSTSEAPLLSTAAHVELRMRARKNNWPLLSNSLLFNQESFSVLIYRLHLPRKSQRCVKTGSREPCRIQKDNHNYTAVIQLD